MDVKLEREREKLPDWSFQFQWNLPEINLMKNIVCVL